MKKEKSKFKDIILGILTAIGLWIFGHLMSGKLSFVEDLVLYETGPLCFLFPFIAAAALILIGKYAGKNNKSAYFKAALIAFFIPLICLLPTFAYDAVSSFFDNTISQSSETVSIIINCIVMVPMFLSIAPISIISKALDCFGFDVQGFKLAILIILYFVPVIFGLVCSIVTFIKSKAKSE